MKNNDKYKTLTVNHGVAGSSPARGAERKAVNIDGFIFFS
jgi:hypothetical protein